MATPEGARQYHEISVLRDKPHLASSIDLQWEIFDPVNSANENPGALAGATGAKDVFTGVSYGHEFITLLPIIATHFGGVVS